MLFLINQWNWWDPHVKSRKRDIGWRIYYLDIVDQFTIYTHIMGSVHCSISMYNLFILVKFY